MCREGLFRRPIRYTNEKPPARCGARGWNWQVYPGNRSSRETGGVIFGAPLERKLSPGAAVMEWHFAHRQTYQRQVSGKAHVGGSWQESGAGVGARAERRASNSNRKGLRGQFPSRAAGRNPPLSHVSARTGAERLHRPRALKRGAGWRAAGSQQPRSGSQLLRRRLPEQSSMRRAGREARPGCSG